jgi:predicted flap endonuclease-1-like 5' DNA nuclease
MPNAALILETALLILAAFLVGCVVGALARRMTLPRRKPKVKASVEATAVPSGPPLVTAPTIAPLPGTRRRSPAERLAAAAGRDADEPIVQPAPATSPAAEVVAEVAEAPLPEPVAEAPMIPLADAPVPAAATESVIILPPPQPTATPTAATLSEPTVLAATEPVPAPTPVADDSFVAAVLAEAPEVEPEPQPVPVAAAEVPSIDEIAHVVDRVIEEPPASKPIAAAAETTAALVLEPEPIASPDLVPPVSDPTSRTALFEDDESAAMRAIEGGWTPRRRSAAVNRPVQHPEYAPSAEVDDAMQSARTAVAAATAAAAAAIAEAQERPRRPARDGLSFEQRSEEMALSFLAGDADEAGVDDDALPADPAENLDFEAAKPVHQGGFGRPEGLPTAREGRPDNLKLIKGVSPGLEASLNGLGVFHFDQIANWDQKAVVWMDNHLSLRGRIVKERWLEQARELGSGRSQTVRPTKR